jgi:hypothetical protein
MRKTILRWQCAGLAGLGLAMTTLTGCQTNVAGMTLPSGHYLNHPPQYFAPSPAFPLQRELATMEAQSAAQTAATVAPRTTTAPVAPPPLPAPVVAPKAAAPAPQ